MSRILFIGSTLIAGAGLGVGGLAIKTLKSESQASYQIVSPEEEEVLEKEDDVGDNDVLEQDLGEVRDEKANVAEEVVEVSNESSTLEKDRPQGGEASTISSTREPTKPWNEECNFYTVKSSGRGTVTESNYSFVEKNIKDKGLLEKIEETCKTLKKAYLINDYKKGWTYKDSDQKVSWKIVTS